MTKYYAVQFVYNRQLRLRTHKVSHNFAMIDFQNITRSLLTIQLQY